MRVFSFYCLVYTCLIARAWSLAQSQAGASHALASRTVFDDELREFVEFLRLQMQCRYPEKGIPVLAPLVFENFELDNKAGDFLFQGNFSDFTVSGLDKFDLAYIKWSNIWHTITFDITYERLHLSSTAYKLNILGQLLGAPVHMFGDGVFDLVLEKLRIHGSFILRPAGIAQGVYIKNFNVKYELGNVQSTSTGIMNSKVYTKIANAWIEQFLQLLINDNPTEVSDFMAAIIVPPLDAVLANVAWYEITALILDLADDVIPLEPIC